MVEHYGSWIMLLITWALIAGTMAAGLIALRKDYRGSDGRLTRPGRALLVVTITVGFLTMGSAWYQEVLVSNKERRQDELNADRFGAQINRLERLASTLADVQRHSQFIADTQSSLLTKTDANLSQSVEINAEATRNAGAVMSRIFEEGHRIDPSEIHLEVGQDCRLPSGGAPPISIESAVLSFVDASGVPRGRVLYRRGGTQLQFDGAEMERLQFLPDLNGLRAQFSLQIGTGIMNLGQAIRHNSSLHDIELMDRCPLEVRVRVNDRAVARASGFIWEEAIHSYAWDLPAAAIDPSVVPRRQ